MKGKVLIILVILLMICFGGYLYLNIFLSHNRVISYGKSKTLSQIINIEEEKVSSYSDENIDFNKFKFRRAIVKELGSTRRESYMIDNNEVIFIGNRNLVKINNKLYIFIRK